MTRVLERRERFVERDEMTEAARLRRDVLELFEAHGPALHRFASVALRQDADAEDVVQEAFIRLLHHLEAGGDRTNLRGWLFTVVSNLCRDRNRRGRRWAVWTPESDSRMTRFDAEASLDAHDRRVELRATLRRLRERDRLLLLLHASGLSYREVAAAAGVQERSVGQLLSRALRRLKRAWPADGDRL